MKKFTLGKPEKYVPSKFCDKFNYIETDVSYSETNFKYKKTAAGFVIEFPMEDDTQIFGFGLQLMQFNHSGAKLKLSVNSDPVSKNGDSHAPVPFFVTNKGYGMYFDTARYIDCYCGKQKKESKANRQVIEGGGTSEQELYKIRKEEDVVMSVLIPAAEGIDIYVIEGDSITDIVKQYNMLSGGGCDVPEWGFGMLYRCYTNWGEEQIKATADYFLFAEIPCDIIGIEPGWQTRKYPCSFHWNLEKFPHPQEFIDDLIEKGFHVNLWEHAYTHSESCLHEPLIPYAGDYLVWGGLVPDFATPEAKKIFADYHREIVAMGIDGFKLDECDSGDYKGSWGFPLLSEFPSGLDGEQYHSLFGVLYAKTILEALDGKETYSQVRQMGALASSYPFVLYSDLYNPREFVRGVVNSGFSGLLWSPEVRSCKTKEDCIRRIQIVVFSAQCLVNAWNYDGIPWVIHESEEEVRELFSLRYQLIPRLKTAFEDYKTTGKPPIRALVMDYTNDQETYIIDDQWLFCDDLLVAPILPGQNDERDLYLPVGSKWVDYYTEEPVESGWIHVNTKDIPVYRRVD